MPDGRIIGHLKQGKPKPHTLADVLGPLSPNGPPTDWATYKNMYSASDMQQQDPDATSTDLQAQRLRAVPTRGTKPPHNVNQELYQQTVT